LVERMARLLQIFLLLYVGSAVSKGTIQFSLDIGKQPVKFYVSNCRQGKSDYCIKRAAKTLNRVKLTPCSRSKCNYKGLCYDVNSSQKCACGAHVERPTNYQWSRYETSNYYCGNRCHDYNHTFTIIDKRHGKETWLNIIPENTKEMRGKNWKDCFRKSKIKFNNGGSKLLRGSYHIRTNSRRILTKTLKYREQDRGLPKLNKQIKRHLKSRAVQSRIPDNTIFVNLQLPHWISWINGGDVSGDRALLSSEEAFNLRQLIEALSVSKNRVNLGISFNLKGLDPQNEDIFRQLLGLEDILSREDNNVSIEVTALGKKSSESRQCKVYRTFDV